MIALKYLLEIFGFALLAAAATVVIVDLLKTHRASLISAGSILTEAEETVPPIEPRWRLATRLTLCGLLPLLIGLSIEVVPAGMAGVRVSQISGTLPDTLYPGLHLVLPLVQHVETFDVRDQIYQTSLTPGPKKEDSMKVQTKEGLELGLAVAVRFRVDPRRLAYVHSNLPQPVEKELVPPVHFASSRRIISSAS